MHTDKNVEKIRIISTILVIIGHCSFYTIKTSIPGMGYDLSSIVIDSTNFHHILDKIVQGIYMFHMQLFIFLSGIVYEICISKGKYNNFKEFVLSKGKRLVLSYLIITFAYNIPIYYHAGYFGDDITKNVFLYIVGFGKNHLWFLVALFEIFIVINGLRLIVQKKYFYWTISVVAVLSFCIARLSNEMLLELCYIDRFISYLPWFIFGMIVKHKVIFLNNRIELSIVSKVISCKNNFVFHLLGSLIMVFIYYLWGIKHVPLTGTMIPFVVILWLTALANTSETDVICKSKFGKLINKYSLELYLYGAPLNYLIFMAIRMNTQGTVNINLASSIMLVILRFAVQLVVPILIAKIVILIKDSRINHNVA